MEKEFVSYEIALALKELGFDEPCFGYYVDGELRGINLGIEELGGVKPYYQRFGFHTLTNSDIDNPNKIVVTSPTFSQAFRWFRDKYKLHSYIKCTCTVNEILSYDWIIHKVINSGTIEENFITDYERTYKEAELECLKNLIEIIKSTEE